MLSYSICKSLKEAGFPQGVDDEGQGYEVNKKNERCHVIEIVQGWVTCHTIKQPTLEELIEACGRNLQCLWHYSDEYWEAFSGPKDQQKKYPSGKGKTPSEAVANLYLALKK